MKTKSQHANRSRRGVTISEMCVVIALLSIVAVMIASFSAMVDKFSSQQQSQYAFLDEVSQTRQSLSQWLSEMDEADTVVTVNANSLRMGDASVSTRLQDGEMTLTVTAKDGTKIENPIKSVTDLQFQILRLSESAAVVKCTVTGEDAYEVKTFSQTFILTLQCGSFAE